MGDFFCLVVLDNGDGQTHGGKYLLYCWILKLASLLEQFQRTWLLYFMLSERCNNNGFGFETSVFCCKFRNQWRSDVWPGDEGSQFDESDLLSFINVSRRLIALPIIRPTPLSMFRRVRGDLQFCRYARPSKSTQMNRSLVPVPEKRGSSVADTRSLYSSVSQ